MTPPTLPAAEITITQAMINAYAAISGDFNPLHVDPEIARATPFGGTIAHGCIPMEPIFQAVARLTGSPVLPAGSTMTLRYLRPSQPGDTIRIEPREAVAGGPARLVAFACVNQRGQAVIEGSLEIPGL